MLNLFLNLDELHSFKTLHASIFSVYVFYLLLRTLATETHLNGVNPIILRSSLLNVPKDPFHSTSELVCLLFHYPSLNFICPALQAEFGTSDEM